jgi:hypothetical protein
MQDDDNLWAGLLKSLLVPFIVGVVLLALLYAK